MKARLVFAALLLTACANDPTAVRPQNTEVLLGGPCSVSAPLPDGYYCQPDYPGSQRGIVVTGN